MAKIRRKGKEWHGWKFIKNLYFSTMQSPHCLNCETPLAAGQHFCSECGQKSVVHRLSLHDIGHDALHYFTHADKGIFSLLWHLARRPGLVAREYVAGKRKKYFPPLNFFLIVAALYVFTLNAVAPVRDRDTVSPAEWARYEKIKDPSVKVKVAAILERRINASYFMSKYSNFVAMIATPLITFFFWMFYRKGRYNYTEHLVANLYFSGFTVLCYALVFGPATRLLGLGGSFNWLLLLFFVFEVGYRAVSYYHFMNKRSAGAAVKAIFVSLAGIVIWFILVYVLMYLYISSGFGGLLS